MTRNQFNTEFILRNTDSEFISNSWKEYENSFKNKDYMMDKEFYFIDFFKLASVIYQEGFKAGLEAGRF